MWIRLRKLGLLTERVRLKELPACAWLPLYDLASEMTDDELVAWWREHVEQ